VFGNNNLDRVLPLPKNNCHKQLKCSVIPKQKAPSIPFEKFEDKVTVTLQIFMLFILKLFLKLHMRVWLLLLFSLTKNQRIITY